MSRIVEGIRVPATHSLLLHYEGPAVFQSSTRVVVLGPVRAKSWPGGGATTLVYFAEPTDLVRAGEVWPCLLSDLSLDLAEPISFGWVLGRVYRRSIGGKVSPRMFLRLVGLCWSHMREEVTKADRRLLRARFLELLAADHRPLGAQ